MSNLVQTRQVLIYYQQTSRTVTLQSSATTWGELQGQIEGDISNKRFVLREGRHTLEAADAVLPAGPITIFAYAKESKAGSKKAKPAKRARVVAKKAKKVAKKTAKKAVKKAAKKVAKKAAKKVKPKKSTITSPPTLSLEDLSREAAEIKRSL